MKGKKPTPTNLKILRGNPGKRSLSKDEPTPNAVCPAPPDVLCKKGKAHWKIIVSQLYDANLMTVLDIDALMLLCSAYAQWVDANEKLQQEGLILMQDNHDKTVQYPKQNPYLTVSNKAFDQMKAMLIEFGMTPSARTRVRTVDKKQPDDGWSDA